MYKTAIAGACTAWLAFGLAAGAQEPGLGIELNKLEDTETGSCRAFFLFRNGSDTSYEGFALSLATFDANGVIDRLLSIDAAPLPAARTTLKLFEIPGAPCGSISEILIHEVDSCRPQNGEETDCFPFLSFSSKTNVPLVK